VPLLLLTQKPSIFKFEGVASKDLEEYQYFFVEATSTTDISPPTNIVETFFKHKRLLDFGWRL
jgi:hypothetical protein